MSFRVENHHELVHLPPITRNRNPCFLGR